jgi:hypothetical protein
MLLDACILSELDLPTQLKPAAEPPTIPESQFLPHPKFDLTDSD